MNKKWLVPMLAVLAIPTFICAQTAFIYLRYKRPEKLLALLARGKRRRVQRREDEIFCIYMELILQQIRADMKIGERAMQRAGVWDENGELAAKYRELHGEEP